MNLHRKVEVKKKSSALETLCFYGLRLSESTLTSYRGIVPSFVIITKFSAMACEIINRSNGSP